MLNVVGVGLLLIVLCTLLLGLVFSFICVCWAVWCVGVVFVARGLFVVALL